MGEGMSGNEAAWRLPEDMGAAELLRKLAGDLLLGDAALYDYLGYGHEGFWGAEKGGVSICRALESLADMVERELLLVELCGLLGIPPMGLIDVSRQELARELGKRVMPEGMEWPRFDDGEPVRFGDDAAAGGQSGKVCRITFYSAGDSGDGTSFVVAVERDDMLFYSPPKPVSERVKRPAPKVLDADGVEIRIDDEVWCRVCGGPLPVTRIDPDGCVYTGGNYAHTGDDLTHSAPVLAADGKPLREGETVYKVGGDGAAYIFDGMSDNVDGLAMLHHDGKPYIGTGLRVDQLTHERPDSWERLEEDADKNPFDYCKDVGRRLDTCENSEAYKARDLVRRAKKLAGIER